MKVRALKQCIVRNYKTLSTASQLPQVEGTQKMWGLRYKNGLVNGFVDELGFVKRNSANVRINKGKVLLDKKPFFSTWRHTLRKINEMLEDTLNNLENKDIVEKKALSILLLPKEALKRLEKAGLSIKQR